MRFEPGTPPQEGEIPLCVPEIRGNEWAYIKECLDTSWVSSAGGFVDRFEGNFAKFVGSSYAVATVNGTSALHTAILAAGIQPEDEVLVSTLTFIAPANAIRYAGAWPVFIDAEPDYLQLDPERILRFLEAGCHWTGHELRNRATGRRVKAILPVHILGHPADIGPVLEAARKYNLVVIEDATESLGSEYQGRAVGSLGDIACFSFNGNKLITTGSGGMLVTDREDLAEKARYLTTQAKDDPVEYVHGEIGYNYRLSGLQAAMGVAQLERIEEYIAAKRRIAATYNDSLSDVPGIVPMFEAPWAKSVFWLYTARIRAEFFGFDSRAVLRELQRNGIQTRPLWQPIHRSPAHAIVGREACPVADAAHRECLSLPCSVGLPEMDQGRVIDLIRAMAHREAPIAS